jgi:prepilin-type processing-associated H-X9-DG protein
MNYFQATSQTLLFTESALLSNSGGWHLEEAVLVTGPQAFQGSDTTWGYFLNFSQFRHTNTANVAFLDGHVQAMTEVAVATPAGWDANVDTYRRKYNLGFPFATETAYNGQY